MDFVLCMVTSLQKKTKPNEFWHFNQENSGKFSLGNQNLKKCSLTEFALQIFIIVYNNWICEMHQGHKLMQILRATEKTSIFYLSIAFVCLNGIIKLPKKAKKFKL